MSRGKIAITWALGLLLIAAAALKLYGLGISAMPQVGWFGQTWVQLLAAQWEVVLGVWLLSGAIRIGSWMAGVGTFLLFAGISCYLGLSGVSSCGCLGAIQASPWWAFGIDVAALALLAFARPRTDRTEISSPVRFGVKWAGGVAVLLIGAALAASAVYGSTEAALARLRGKTLIAMDLDLGTGKPGNPLDGSATIRNISDHPIRLVGGTADCTCTAVRDLPLTLEPGEAASIGIQLHIPENQSGRIWRTVTLRTDDTSQAVVFLRVGYRVE